MSALKKTVISVGLLLVWLGSGLMAQSPFSLEAVRLFQDDRIDTVDLDLLNSEMTQLIQIQANEAIPYVQQAIDEAKRRDSLFHLALFTYSLGWAHDLSGRQDVYCQYVKEALALTPGKEVKMKNLFLDKLADCWMKSQQYGKADSLLRHHLAHTSLTGEARGKMHGTLANGFFYQGNYDSAAAYAVKSLNLLEQYSDSINIAEGYRKAGIVYMQQGKMDLAAQYFLGALNFYQVIEAPLAEAMILDYLCHIYHREGNQEKAKGYGEQALAKWKLSGNDTVTLVSIHNNLGNVAKELGDDQKAIHHLRLGHQITMRYGGDDQWTNRATTAMNLAILFMDNLAAYDSADRYLNTAHECAKKSQSQTTLITYLTNRGELHRFQENYEEALVFYDRALPLAKEVDYQDALNALYRFRTLALIGSGQKEKAIEAYEGHLNRLDSLAGVENESLLAEMEANLKNYQIRDSLTQVTIERRLADQAKAQWRNFSLIIGIGLLVTIGLGIWLYWQMKRNQRLNQELGLRAERISFLHRELDHRVKNNLNFLSSMLALQSAKEQKPDVQVALGATKSRVQALVILHQLMRDENGEKGKIALPQYLNPLIHQVKEMAHPREAPLDLTIQIEPISIPEGDALSLALILNEWLTNAFKYAVPKVESPQISIRVSAIGNDQLVLEVADNGPGYEPAAVASSSYGTTLVQSQIRQLRGQLQFDNSQGTHYTLTFKTSIEK